MTKMMIRSAPTALGRLLKQPQLQQQPQRGGVVRAMAGTSTRTASSLVSNAYSTGSASGHGMNHPSVVSSSYTPCSIRSLTTATPPLRSSATSDGPDSHSDFAPKPKAPGSSQEEEEAMKKTLAMIDQQVQENPVMLYMKGNPQQPMCGFSARVIQVLQSTNIAFASVNVLNYPTIRQGIKQYSQWPTIPQLYVKGEFIGGCDIVESMHSSGELQELLQKAVEPTTTTKTSKTAEEKSE